MRRLRWSGWMRVGVVLAWAAVIGDRAGVLPALASFVVMAAGVSLVFVGLFRGGLAGR